MIKHILLMKFKPSTTTKQIDKLRVEFYRLQNKIDSIKNIEWGVNNSQENKNKEYSHSIIMTFIDIMGRDNYLRHPEHEQFKVHFEQLLEDIIVFDYQL